MHTGCDVDYADVVQVLLDAGAGGDDRGFGEPGEGIGPDFKDALPWAVIGDSHPGEAGDGADDGCELVASVTGWGSNWSNWLLKKGRFEQRYFAPFFGASKPAQTLAS
jgi:hypothetical protein